MFVQSVDLKVRRSETPSDVEADDFLKDTYTLVRPANPYCRAGIENMNCPTCCCGKSLISRTQSCSRGSLKTLLPQRATPKNQLRTSDYKWCTAQLSRAVCFKRPGVKSKIIRSSIHLNLSYSERLAVFHFFSVIIK